MNIKEAIEKLNTINLQDLKRIDLNQLKDLLRRSPIFVLNIVFVFGSCFTAITLFNKAKLDEKNTKASNISYEEKLKAVKEQKSIKQKYQRFVNDFPKELIGRQLIDKFSELATNRNVHIISFSPTKEKSDQYTTLTTVNLSIESDDYKNIILFVKDIESFPFAVRLEKFSAAMQNSIETNMNTDDKKDLINVDIEVSSVRIK